MSKIIVPSEDKTSFPPLRSFTASGIAYRLGHQIGVGAFSKVYKGTDSWGNRIVAKVLSPEVDPKLWEREVEALQRFRHPCVVHLQASFQHKDYRFLVMEDAGVCLARLQYNESARLYAAMAAARGLLQALHFVHAHGFIHGDICPNNVLALDPKRNRLAHVRLADFAFCRPVKTLTSGMQKIAQWQHAPETLERARFGSLGTATDVYLAAMVLHSTITGSSEQFSEEQAARGEPQAQALAWGTRFGAALAEGLEPVASRRPSALELWQRLQAAVRPAA